MRITQRNFQKKKPDLNKVIQDLSMIVIYGIKAKLNPIKAGLSDVIHGCMQAVLGMPEDKRAHRFVPLDRDDFYYPGGRSDAYTVRMLK